MYWPEEEEKAEKNYPSQMRKSLTKSERISKKSDFKIIFNESSSLSCKGLKLFYRKNGLDYTRFAVTLRRKYGNAVVRNHSKRQLREIFRQDKEKIDKGWDILALLYPGDFSYQCRKRQLLGLLNRADLIEDQNIQWSSNTASENL